MHNIREANHNQPVGLPRKSTDNAQDTLRAILSRLNDFISPDTTITKSANYPGLYLLENPFFRLNRRLLMHINYNLGCPCP